MESRRKIVSGSKNGYSHSKMAPTPKRYNFVYKIMSLHNHPLFSEKRAASGFNFQRAIAPIDRNTAENWPIAT